MDRDKLDDIPEEHSPKSEESSLSSPSFPEVDSFTLNDSALNELFKKFVDSLPDKKSESLPESSSTSMAQKNTKVTNPSSQATPDLQEVFKAFYSRHHPGYEEENKRENATPSVSSQHDQSEINEMDSSFRDLWKRYSNRLKQADNMAGIVSETPNRPPDEGLSTASREYHVEVDSHTYNRLMATWRERVALAGCFMLDMTLGHIFTLGNLGGYLVSAIPDGAWRTTERVPILMLWISCANVNAIAFTALFGYWMERRVGVFLTALLGSFIYTGSISLTYLSIPKGSLMTILTYGISLGAGVGITYSALLSYRLRWYQGQQSLINGLVTAAFAIGGASSLLAQTYFINPQNLHLVAPGGYFLDTALRQRVPTYFLHLGAVIFLLSFVGLTMLKCGRLTWFPKVYQMVLASSFVGSTTSHITPSFSPSTIHVMSDQYFYVLWVALLFTSPYLHYIATCYKVFGQRFITNDWALALLGAGCASVNACSHILWCRLSRFACYKYVMIVNNCITALLAFLFPLIPSKWYVAYGAWVLISFLVNPGILTLFARVVTDLYGIFHFVQNFAILSTAILVGTVLNPLLISMLQHVWYIEGPFFFLGILTFLGFCATLLIPENAAFSMKPL